MLHYAGPLQTYTTDPTYAPVASSAQATKLVGGVDGVYKLSSCYNGKPMYRRKKPSPAGEERVMWYSSTFGDWDVSRVSKPGKCAGLPAKCDVGGLGWVWVECDV